MLSLMARWLRQWTFVIGDLSLISAEKCITRCWGRGNPAKMFQSFKRSDNTDGTVSLSTVGMYDDKRTVSYFFVCVILCMQIAVCLCQKFRTTGLNDNSAATHES